MHFRLLRWYRKENNLILFPVGLFFYPQFENMQKSLFSHLALLEENLLLQKNHEEEKEKRKQRIGMIFLFLKKEKDKHSWELVERATFWASSATFRAWDTARTTCTQNHHTAQQHHHVAKENWNQHQVDIRKLWMRLAVWEGERGECCEREQKK